MKDLESSLKEDVVDLCNKALEAQEEERYHASNRLLQQVYTLLPEPKSEWKAYIWLVSNIGDNYFEQGEYQEAIDAFNEVVELDASSDENAYLCLRRGQCALELEIMDSASLLLKRAFELEGKDIFDDEHSKYLKLAKQG